MHERFLGDWRDVRGGLGHHVENVNDAGNGQHRVFLVQFSKDQEAAIVLRALAQVCRHVTSFNNRPGRFVCRFVSTERQTVIVWEERTYTIGRTTHACNTTSRRNIPQIAQHHISVPTIVRLLPRHHRIPAGRERHIVCSADACFYYYLLLNSEVSNGGDGRA